jgi:hypothetical protein
MIIAPHDVRAVSARKLLDLVRTVVAAPVDDTSETPLEWRQMPASPPRVVAPAALEQGFATKAVDGEPMAVFGGFLDGVQESRVVSWLPSGVPIVLAVVGAVILERNDDRRLTAWRGGARVRRSLILPRALVDEALWNALSSDAHVEDSGAGAADRHPDSLLASAVTRVEALRTAEERELAVAWMRERSDPLAADGSLSALGGAADSDRVVGIVKSHRTLHAHPDALSSLLALAVGARTAVALINDNGKRAPVATWYLRLRPASAANPMHGLVRIEVAPPVASATERADDVSRWVMAERTPVAMPDARWDVMSYGIARCESYLKRGLALRAQA